MEKTKFIEHLKEKEFPIEIETKNSSIKILKIEEHHFNFNVNSKLIGIEGIFKAYQFYNDCKDNDYEKERIINNLKKHLSYAIYGEVINELEDLFPLFVDILKYSQDYGQAKIIMELRNKVADIIDMMIP